MENLTFADLIDIDSLQMLQECFSRYTGLAINVVDMKGDAVLEACGCSDFCSRLTKGTERGLARCNECDRNGASKAYEMGEAYFYTCHAGMTDFVIPINFEGRVIGTILAGQVRSDDFDVEKTREAAIELGLDPDEYVEAALNTRYISREGTEQVAGFLADIAKAISVMAQANYKKYAELQKTERIARSQSDFITNLTEELRASMKGWIDGFRATTDKYADIPEIRQETDALLLSAGEVYSQIGGAVDYIRMAGGIAEYSEGIYDIRQLIEKTAAPLRKKAEAMGVAVKTYFDDALPETLAGNSGRFGQILNTIGMSVVNFTNEGGEVEISASVEKTDYSCILIVRIIGIGTRMTEKAAEAIRTLVQGGSVELFGEEGRMTSKDSDFPLILLLLKQISGSIEAEELTSGRVVFKLSVPQLDGSKKSA